MYAANPLCRWLLAVGMAAAIGCGSTGGAKARGQMPPDPVAPLAPLPPIAPTGPAAGSPATPGPAMPAAPGAPVAGSPVTPDSVAPADVQKTGYSALPKVVAALDQLKDGIPQIKVVALVGARNLVTDQEVLEAVRQRLGELNGFDGHARKVKEKEMYTTELRRIIERELVLDEMYTRLKQANKLTVVDDIKEFATKAADSSIRAIRKHYGNASEEEFNDILRSQGLTKAVIHRQLERQFMADEYVRSVLKEKGRTPSLGDLRAYYETHPDEFKTADAVKWLDIFISFNRHATPRAAYDHALAVQKQAAGGADFVALVKQYDNGLASGTNGVGIGTKRGEIQPPDVEPTVWALKPGQVSNLIQTPAGYHIVKIAEREVSGLKPFDHKIQGEIRDKMVRQFREAEFQKMVEDLWRKGPVKVIEIP